MNVNTENFAEIAKAALDFQNDPRLPPRQRRLAQCLHQLASQLCDPEYGCPTETLAVSALYRHLQAIRVHSLHGTSQPAASGNVRQAHRIESAGATQAPD